VKARVIDIAVLIDEVATAKVRIPRFVIFMHHASGLFILGFVHGIPPLAKNLNESAICQVSGAVG
jgi:hypothetical protein